LTNPPIKATGTDIQPVNIEEEMKRSYLDYAMSVIVARAIPDVRDGLKPVHRRIMYSMRESGYDHSKPFRKSARIVGDVMGRYHPHGDSAIYDAMVRMAQDFSMRLPLVSGQGNFGSMDGDPAAAMRYTEARLAKSSQALLDDIDKDTVSFQANYDESTSEPTVLPARFPNLLVNGAGGIAVGMATNIPPHNLGEVVDACCAYIEDPEISLEDLMVIVPGPDFPTGGVIVGRAGARAAYTTGRGSVILRARCEIEEIRKDRMAIIVHEVPYQVNKASMIEKIAELVRDKRVEGIAALRDESDRRGVRVVIELKRDAQPEVVLNQLYRFTPLQSSFGVNMLALNQGRPQLLTLKDVIKAFIHFREEVVRRRTEFELGKARDRAHVLVGLAIAVANLDAVIKMIRAASDPNAAREALTNCDWDAADVEPLIALIDEPGRGVVNGTYRLSDAQARAILDLRLHRLTGLERSKIHEELTEIGVRIEDYLETLRSREKLYGIIRDEMVEVKALYADKRRTTFEENEFEHDIEDLIPREDMVLTYSSKGYVKRVPLSTYRAQKRGGKGRTGMATRDEDFVQRVYSASTHTPLLFFSSLGMAYKLKAYKLPLGNPTSRGRPLVNLLPLEENETISAILRLPEDETEWENMYIAFATARGDVRRNRLSDFGNVMSNGKIAMKLESGDRLISVRACAAEDDIVLSTRKGKCIRFPIDDVRVFVGRSSTGVRGIRLADDDEVIGLTVLRHADYDSETREAYLKRRRLEEHLVDGEEATVEPSSLIGDDLFAEMKEAEQFMLVVTANGFGKRSSAYEYRVTGRGGQGIMNIDATDRNGDVVASFPVRDSDQLMLVSDGGQLIRMPVHDIRIAARKTQGVTLFRMGEDEQVVSATRLDDAEMDEDDVAFDGEGDEAAVPGDTVQSADDVPNGETD
jgi:DNA gyrase subunit A